MPIIRADPVNVLAAPTATLAGSQTILEVQSASLSVTLTGAAPWSFSYRDSSAAGSGAVQSVQANSRPYTMSVKPSKTTAYRLTTVSNICKGSTSSAAIVIIAMPLLGIDDSSLEGLIDVFPVPAAATVTARIRNSVLKSDALFLLTDLNGQPLQQQAFKSDTATLQLDTYPAGTYILQIRIDDRTVSRRILKQ